MSVVATKDQFEQLQTVARDHVELIKMSKDSFKDPLDRAAKFLVVRAYLADARRGYELDKAKLETISEALFASAMETAQGKTVTEKKIAANADPIYSEAKDSLDNVSAMITWIKTMDDIFSQAHVTYRQMAKGD